MATVLRQLYADLCLCSTAEQSEKCSMLLEQLVDCKADNLARHFADAVEANQAIVRIERGFIPDTRGVSTGRNPVVEAMAGVPELTVEIPHAAPYKFAFLSREVPHLRAMTSREQEQTGKGWIDYVGRTQDRPILGEIKWKDDKNPFYAFIQLLTYLSEIATANQITRSIQHRLYGDDIPITPTFDLHILLVNFNDRGAKGRLIWPTRDLAEALKKCLKEDGRVRVNLLGDVLCLDGKIEDPNEGFSSFRCHWLA
jgi:hypothetical protein